MTSFATDLLDGFDACYKRTIGILKSTHEIGSFFNKLSTIRKEYLNKYLGLIRSYGQKKLLVNGFLDGTVKKALETMVTDMESVTNHDLAFSNKISEISTEVANFVRDKEVKRKKLETDGKRLTREFADQLDALKRSKANYMKLSREAELAQQEHQKAQGDPKTKSQKLTQLATRASQAADKAKQADQEYKDTLRTSNDKQTQLYTKDMPSLLAEFQTFEEERIRYVQQTVKQYAQAVLEFPAVYKKAGDASESFAGQIDVAADVLGFVNTNKTGVHVPPAIEYEGYNPGGGPPPVPPTSVNSHPPPPSSHGGGSTTTVTPTPTPPNTSTPTPVAPKEWGLLAGDESLSVAEKQNKLTEQQKEIEKQIKNEESQVTALERLIQFYATDPGGKKKTEDELAELHKKVAALKAGLAKVQSQLAGLSGGTPGGAPAPTEPEAAAEVQVQVRGMYDYTATCDTELSFKEGEIFVVSEQDSSGWWYATIGDKSGFVPQNYVEVVTPPSS
ncbi:cdc42-interacting protein 4 [Pelomyxa schiedti]|nr:cdc42-interacting protein 4 [Pelomyxa schiedti]